MLGLNRFRCQVAKEIMRCDYAVPPRARRRAPSLSVGFTPIGSYNWKLQATLPSILVFLLGLPLAHPGRSQRSRLLVAFSCVLRRDELDGSESRPRGMRVFFVLLLDQSISSQSKGNVTNNGSAKSHVAPKAPSALLQAVRSYRNWQACRRSLAHRFTYSTGRHSWMAPSEVLLCRKPVFT
jgi:hypothetical protein